MTQADEDLQIVKTITTLADNLGMQVIAEGVENEDQLTLLRQMKCQYAQGYLFSKPLDAAQADEFVMNGSSTIGLSEVAVVELEADVLVM
jgi:EAL domain-containing protein (putative c-di-GMP-specific phosphodiesterase class I)